MQHQKVKERLKKDYAMRLRMILISQLNAKNEVTETEELDVQVFRYSFGVINWRVEKIRKTDRKSRDTDNVQNSSPKGDIDRLYVKR